MSMKIRGLLWALSFVIWLSLASPVTAQEAAEAYFTDTLLVDQHGRQLRFYSDVLKDRVVVINSFFTSCQGVCPVMMGLMEKLQKALEDRMGSEVFLVSISVDPVSDTPERLQAYAQRFSAGPGWLLLTGPKENVDFVLSKLGQYVETRENHSNQLVIGNVATGLWKKALGLASLESVLPIVESVLNDGG